MLRPRSFLASLSSILLLLMLTPSVLAQDYPWPTKKGETPAATDPSSGLPLYPYDSPIKDHLGRFVDSSGVRDCAAGPRTLRAKETMVDHANGRLYMRMGETFAAYNLSTFFGSRIGSPLGSEGINHPSACVTDEKYLRWDLAVDPEYPGSGWQIYIIDGQQRLYDFDVDDRGYIYVAYYVWGWGILQKDSLSLVKQVTWEETITPKIIKHFTTGAKHYILVSAGNTEIWDVTNPSSPLKVQSPSINVDMIDSVKVGGADIVAIIESGNATLRLYHASDLAAGRPAFKTLGSSYGGWRGLSNDGVGFVAAEATSTRTNAHITDIAAATGTTSSVPIGDMRPDGINYSDGHLTVWGRASDGVRDAWLFERKGLGWSERPLNNYFRNHYTNPPKTPAPGYSGPNSVYNDVIWKLEYVKYQGREFLLYSGYGLGDVYELEATNKLNISLNGVAGSINPNTPSSSTGTFYGDPLRFSSEYKAGTIAVNWNFGNPQGIPTRNQQTLTVGQDVVYQYAGLTTKTAIESPKTVTGTSASDSTNSSSVTVSMKAPAARIRLQGPEAIFPGADLSKVGVAAGDRFVDASDGTIQGHYAEWSLDGVPATGTPSESLGAGACGVHTLNFAAHYVPYVGTGAAIVADLDPSKHYVQSVGPLTYEVKPFIPAIDTASSASDVTFRNKTRYRSTTFGSGAQWTVTWSLLNAAKQVVMTEGDTSAVGTTDTFVVPKTTLQSGYSVVMSVAVEATALTDASCAAAGYLTAEATYVVEPPDPSIAVSGCTVALSSCELTATSLSGADVSGWSVQWYLDGAPVSTSKTYKPTFSTAGTYQVRLAATNDFGSQEKTQSLNVSAPVCSGKPVGITFGARGLTSNCTGSGCTAGETIKFSVFVFGYKIQDCDTFSWSFGDGTSSSVMEPTHVFPTSPSSYSVKLTVSNVNGNTSYTSTISFGSGGPPNPPPTCTAPGAGTVFPSFVGPQSGCSDSNPNCVLNESIQFNGATWGYNVQPSCDTFSWNFGDGTSSNQRHPKHAYASQGTYTVSFTISNTGGSAGGTTTVIVGEPVDPNCRKEAVLVDLDYSGPTSGCSSTSSTGCLTGEAIKFQPVTWQYNWQPCDEFLWDFGDGQTSTEESPTHTYDASNDGEDITVKLTVSNKHGSTTVSRTFLVGTPATKPTNAEFTYAPSTPKPGESITFAASTSGGDPATSWAWDFGDGATGTGQTVTHTFAIEGSFKVLLRAANSGGEAFREKTLSVSERISYLLPVVTHAAGLNGTAWRTDLHVYQPQYASPGVEVELEFKGTKKMVFFDSSTKIFEDFLGEITSADDAGPVFLHAPLPLDMWTRTYVVSATGVGTYGQLIPAMRLGGSGPGGAVENPTFWNIGGLRNTDRFRTNLGFVNPTNQRADVTVHMYEEQFGLEIGKFDVSVEGHQFRQQPLTVWFSTLPKDVGVSLRIESRNHVDLMTYASIIDNISNDPVFVGAVPDSSAARPEARAVIVPGVGHIGSWRSDLTVFNPDSQAASIDLKFYGEDGSLLGSTNGVILPSKGSFTVEDLLRSDVMDVEADALGTLKVETTSENGIYPIVFDRTYNDQLSMGTFGQGIPAVPTEAANVTLDRPAYIAGVRSDSSYRTNLGLVSLSSETTEIAVQILHPIDGGDREQQIYVLQPNQSKLIPRVVSDFLGSSLASGAIKIKVLSGGPIWAYASVIDNLTEDPEYVPAVRSAPAQ